MSARLLLDLDHIRAAFPGSYHLTITSFELSAAPERQLTAVTAKGPRILFGQMITDEQIDTLDAKLAALNALGAQVTLSGGCFDSINLMNPNSPTTHCPSPSPAPSPTPGRTAPKPKASPTPSASPSPHR
jgi:hypothetical protein